MGRCEQCVARRSPACCFARACAFVWYAAYLLGRRAEVQPFKYAFGGEPEPRDYGRTLADGALLILLACFGLAERGHETTPQLAQFVGIAMLVYGLVRMIDKPIQGALTWGLGTRPRHAASSPVLVGALLLGTLAMTLIVREARPRWLLLVRAAGRARAVAGVADRRARRFFPDDAVWYLNQWVHVSLTSFAGPPGRSPAMR